MRRKQNGNVLFLILIAVALFAALSYAVTQSSRSGGEGISRDKAKLVAGQIIQYGASVEQAISRMKLINRCNDTDISLYIPGNADFANYLHSPPSETRCRVFHPDGGGLQPLVPDENWLDPTYAADTYYGHGYYAAVKLGHTTNGLAGTTALDLLFLLPYLTQTLCEEISRRLDAPIFQEDNGIAPNPYFAGDYSQASASDINNSGYDGKRYSGCIKAHDPFVVGSYMYFHAVNIR